MLCPEPTARPSLGYQLSAHKNTKKKRNKCAKTTILIFKCCASHILAPHKSHSNDKNRRDQQLFPLLVLWKSSSLNSRMRSCAHSISLSYKFSLLSFLLQPQLPATLRSTTVRLFSVCLALMPLLSGLSVMERGMCLLERPYRDSTLRRTNLPRV